MKRPKLCNGLGYTLLDKGSYKKAHNDSMFHKSRVFYLFHFEETEDKWSNGDHSLVNGSQ
jgi:hypothetical protein